MRCFLTLLPLFVVTLGCAGSEAVVGPDSSLTVARGDFAREVLLTGELVAEDALKLITPQAGIWPVPIRWLAEDGTEVVAGELVAEFDNSQLAGNLEELRLSVSQATNELAKTRARVAAKIGDAAYAVEQARAELEKETLRANVPREILEGIEYEERQLNRRRAELKLGEAEKKLTTEREAGVAEIEIQRIALDKARRALRRAEEGIELLSLHAPRDGLVLRADHWREGRPFQAGDDTWPGSAVASLPVLETMIVEAQLFDVDDGRIAPGQRALLTLDAYPDEPVTGRVRSIEPMASATSSSSRRRAFRVVVDLDAIDVERMRPGMSVKVAVETETRADVLLLPRASVDWGARPPRVRLANGDWVTPELGPCDARACVVRSGLDEGSRLAPAFGDAS